MALEQTQSIMLLFLLLLLAREGSAKYCNYTKLGVDGTCINPKESASSPTFSFEPLFPGEVKFACAIDELKGQVFRKYVNISDDAPVAKPDAPLVAWWLEYDSVHLNDTDLTMVTDMAVWFTSVNSDVGGGENNCENLIRYQCINQIRHAITDLFWDGEWEAGALAFLAQKTSRLDQCPRDIEDTLQWEEPLVDICRQ